MKKDAPYFLAWTHADCAQFAAEQYAENIKLREAIEQLRLDLKDAMKLVRKQHDKDDWK